MKLSEAIRKGSDGRRHIRHNYADNEGGVCALGAAALAVGVDEYYLTHGRMVEETMDEDWPTDYRIYREIIERNDDLRQSFAEIADWLEEQGY